MKKIGREVLFIKGQGESARNGEGDFIRLRDGRIMFAYTEYTSSDADDHAIAQISAVFSKDEGETWSDKRVLIQKSPDSINIMCVSFIRMKNGDIGLFYCEKYFSSEGDICIELIFRRSNDEGENFCEGIKCINKEGYYVAENARMIMLSNGRILCPLNLHKSNGTQIENEGVFHLIVSDDDGKSFYDTNNAISHPYGDIEAGLQETGIVEMENGKLFSFSRTATASQFESFSLDSGLTWTKPFPSMIFSSPTSPMHIRHLENDYSVAVFNPISSHSKMDSSKTWGRTPLAVFFTKGRGENFWNEIKTYLLEDDLDNGYCYPSVFAGKDYFLCSYYHSDNTGNCLCSCKIVKVMYSEFE